MRARALRGLALVAVLGAGAGCNAVLGIEALEAEEGAGGAAEAGGGAGGGGGHAGDASVEGGGGSGGSGGGAGDAASEQAGGSGGGGGAADDAGDAGGSGGSGGCTGTTCSLPNATGICTSGICKVDHCALHYEDCDSTDSNGCEASLWTDVANCNACGSECSSVHGTPSCVAGVCKIGCTTSFDDCDANVANGCETDTSTDVAHCGACTNACANAHGTTGCTSGVCKPVCSGSFADCDGNVANGCETNTSTSAGNCGQCGKQCATGEICSNGKCTAPSCAASGDGQTNCGSSGTESCCTSLSVPGGTVELDSTHTATVSDYRLDKYEITVGRFRAFVDAVVGGWTPAAGSGKHTHLNGGSGLSNGNGGYEPGWDTGWNTNLPTTTTAWSDTDHLSCNSTYRTWTSAAEGNERWPINCVNWYEAEAFCIWDGGFLPSEAEWQYAAAGGNENRTYPWGSTVPGANANLAVYGCYWNGTGPGSCSGVTNIAPVGSVAAGNGKYGQSDLAGNMWEWTLDWYADPYPLSSSTTYANTTSASYRVNRGGSVVNDASSLLASARYYLTPTNRGGGLGGRCARTP